MRHHSHLSLLAVVLLLLVASCSTSKRAVRPDTSALKEWHDISVPVNLAIHAPKQFSTGSVTMYMVKGEEITFSMRFLGMVVGAIHLTPDSLMAYSVPQRIYVAEDLASALGGVSLPLADIQTLLIGQSFPAFEKIPALNSIVTVGTRTNPTTNQPESLTFSQADRDREVQLSWLRDEAESALPFASALDINLTRAASTSFSATITYSWDRATIDSNPVRRFKLPANYKRVAGRDLLKGLTSF